MTFERGTVIAGKYRVERVIGQGGMGIVLAARHLGLDEMVAVKLVRAERADGADALARFQREARAAARIKSEHVARVLDVDRLPNGAPYIVMELIDGTDLHALLERQKHLPVAEAASYVVQACEGLADAHAHGMVHRDLKLKNLFLTRRRDGRPLIKVIDFGVVKLGAHGDDRGDDDGRAPRDARDDRPARDATLTGASTLLGSVHYMAPEQIRASNVVRASADVWSLGVCLYTLLTGELPFDGPSVSAICAAIQGRPADDVRRHAPDVPAELASAIAKMLERDLRRRFADVAAVAEAVAPFGDDPSAPARVRAILASKAPIHDDADVHAAEGGISDTIVAAPGAMTSSGPLASWSGAHTGPPIVGRAESTLTHAPRPNRHDSTMGAVDVAPRAASRPRGRGWLPLVLAATVFLGIGGFLAIRHRATDKTTNDTRPSANASWASAAPTASARDAPAGGTGAIPSSSAPATTVSAARPSAPPPSRANVDGGVSTKRPPRRLSPEPEPSSAYDHF